MDADGYPDDAELERIWSWPHDDLPALFAFIRERWHLADWGWYEADGRYHVSTAGWSGNEILISALEQNTVAWTMTWQESRRGGHYRFRLPERALDPELPDMRLLAKLARGEGGERTGVLKEAGYLEWTVTAAGREALAKWEAERGRGV